MSQSANPGRPAGPTIVLASASPRRRDLLARAGLAFTVVPSDVDESVPPGITPDELARSLAERKALAVAARLPSRAPCWVLGADTVVAVPGVDSGGCGTWELLGKPTDEQDAARMLRRLSASRHQVVTGVAVVTLPAGVLSAGVETTWVTMRRLGEEDVADYVASGEWRDKAGGYAIQESADRFVTALEGGGFDNVVGLPVERALALLRRAGAPVP